jgi:hypothetical protein
MTPLVEIYAMAREHGIRLCPHRGSEVWSLHAMVWHAANPSQNQR